ncbi:MAG: hypothetical protein IPL62_19235 [Caulobacteraceae bacterium]|nr:hypothetical protein [Caulobacteraceae bacterium]
MSASNAKAVTGERMVILPLARRSEVLRSEAEVSAKRDERRLGCKRR